MRDMLSAAIVAGGLHAALSTASGPATAVVACDMPYVSAPLLRYRLSVANESNAAQEADIVVPKTERGYHPLVRVVTGESLTVFGEPDRLLANVNTSIEYKAIEANGMQS